MISDGIIVLIGLLSVFNLILVCKVFKIFTEITNNQEELLYLLRDDINLIKDHVIIPKHINCRCETGVVFENDKRES